MRYHLAALIPGICLLLVALYILKGSLDFIDKSERAVGKVTGWSESSGDGGITYAPVFTIVTRSGHEIYYTHTVTSAPPSWEMGEEADFLYDPADADSARILTYFGLFSWSIVLLGVAAFLITYGGVFCMLRAYLRPGINVSL